MNKIIKQLGERFLSKSTRKSILRATRWPRVGHVQMGDLRRLTPLNRNWGGDRGLSIDRYYVEQFLEASAADIHGHVLEVGDSYYTNKFGGEKVTKASVVHAAAGNPIADYVADFADAPHLPSDTFDCIICTQTLHLIPNMVDGISTLYRILKPGGILLVTVPGISQIYRDEDGLWPDYWRFTTNSARWLFTQVFTNQNIWVQKTGNVLTSTAFLNGLSAEDLTQEELDFSDDDYHMVVMVRAKK